MKERIGFLTILIALAITVSIGSVTATLVVCGIAVVFKYYIYRLHRKEETA